MRDANPFLWGSKSRINEEKGVSKATPISRSEAPYPENIRDFSPTMSLMCCL